MNKLVKEKAHYIVSGDTNMDEETRKFVLSAIESYKIEGLDRVKLVLKRILLFIPVMSVFFVVAFLVFLKSLKNYTLYGGEHVLYSKGEKATIYNIFQKLKEDESRVCK